MIMIITIILLMIMRMGGGVVSKLNYSQAEQLPPFIIHLITITIVTLSSSNFHSFSLRQYCQYHHWTELARKAFGPLGPGGLSYNKLNAHHLKKSYKRSTISAKT